MCLGSVSPPLLVYGPHGGGVAEAQGVDGCRVHLHVGTLSKAFGSQGGFVGCSARMRQLLLSRGRAGIYSTALPMPAVAAASAALCCATPQRRALLWETVAKFAEAAAIEATSPIVPIIVGSEELALEAAEKLLGSGFLVPAIRPPTVPRGTARLRVALSASHPQHEVRRLGAALQDFRRLYAL